MAKYRAGKPLGVHWDDKGITSIKVSGRVARSGKRKNGTKKTKGSQYTMPNAYHVPGHDGYFLKWSHAKRKANQLAHRKRR